MNRYRKLRTSKYLRYIARHDGFALYHSLYGGLCIVDSDIRYLFEVFQTSRSAHEVVTAGCAFDELRIQSFMQLFEERGFLVEDGSNESGQLEDYLETMEKRLHKGGQVGVVQLVLTNLCNFRCEYCFVNSIYSSKERLDAQASKNNRVMHVEEARTYLENVIDIARKNGKTGLSVQFFGGEPLLNWKVMKFVLEHFGAGEEHGLEITYSVVTNGSLITDEIAAYCKKHKVSVIVSFDAPSGEQRVCKNGKNGGELVEQGLSLLNKYYNHVAFNAVLSSETFAVFGYELVDFALEHYVFEIGVLLDLSPGFYEKYSAKDIVDTLWDVYCYGKQKGVQLTGYWHMIFQQLVHKNLYRTRGFKTCSATGCQLSIEPSGDVFACKGSSGYFGNILRIDELLASENYRKYASRAFSNSPECAGCAIEGFCSGFCLGPLEKKYGSISVMEKNACAVYMELTRRLIADMDSEDVAVFTMQRPEKVEHHARERLS
ncbi:radical SAM/SPASM domain-containing protein [Prosthecochloris sp. SCSIO W1103]|uniref:radical SAM/SPASM domain-containing protein n=1 Tax=Prosthecochloris sp. SCSIO W1103 TaxID=2992244 RepID=UPI00223E8AFF|nr:radical SAM protein [Prosthecochloris sp. SCSIO W1103]UZJ37035.1 radical SAM protein [Prosthecochloris sp. SCSIO W1103]